MPYLDTSIVLPYYIHDPFSSDAQDIFTTYLAPAISELVELEFFSALSLRLRTGDMRRAQADRAVALFLSHLEGGFYRRLHLNAGHYIVARELIARFDVPLRAPDALHLAIAAAESLPLITADQQLARAAEHLNLELQLLRP